MIRRIAFVIAALTFTTPVIAADPVARALSDLLNECPQVPDAAAVLIALQSEHRIGRPAGTGASAPTMATTCHLQSIT